MCEDELIEDLIMKIPKKMLNKSNIEKINFSYLWIPIMKWKKSVPRYPKLELHEKQIKTWGKVKYKKYYKLVSEFGLIRSVWKYDFIPNSFKIKDGILYFRIPEGKLGIWYITKNNKINFLVLPKNIRIDNELCEGLGLLDGEMIKSMRGKSRHYISFTNSQPILIKKAMKILLKFIPKDRLLSQIILNIKDENNIERLKKESLRYWIRNVGIKKTQFVKIMLDKRYRTTVDFGSLSIKYYDTFLRFIFQNILEIIKKDNIPSNEEFTKSFFKGLFAAESSVNLAPNNYINYISIGVSSPKEREYYINMLNFIGIKTGFINHSVSNEDARKRGWKRGTGGYFVIQGIENYLKVYEYGLLEMFPKKLLYFLFGLINYRYNKIDSIESNLNKLKIEYKYEFEELLGKKKILTKRDKEVLDNIELGIYSKGIAEKLKINKSSASRILNSIYRKGHVNKNIRKGKVFWTKK
ncbi:MAG: hypothetical protein ISS36_02280 [Candidatus Aenigmarchaeota archaeon]|nr:hypothetical protein [Candidatus Aenigmarchaeota archaeon]